MSERRISLASILIASIGVVALIGGIVFFVAGQFGGQGGGEPGESAVAESQPEGQGADTPSVNPDDPEASRCGLTAYSDTDDLQSTAPQATWEWVGNAFMISKGGEHGPGVVEDNGVRYCYARTPTGVLFAAYNVGAMGFSMPHSEFVQYTIAPGPIRDMYAGRTEEPGYGEYKMEPAGFRIESYNANEAIVGVACYVEDSLFEYKLKLQWIEGDWLVSPVDEKSFFLDTGTISNIAGYVPWSVT